MFLWQRVVGESVLVETPRGIVSVRLEAVPDHHKVTIAIEWNGQVWLHNRNAAGKPIHFRLPEGTVRVEVREIREKGRWGRALLAFEAPREWFILRSENLLPIPDGESEAGQVAGGLRARSRF